MNLSLLSRSESGGVLFFVLCMCSLLGFFLSASRRGKSEWRRSRPLPVFIQLQRAIILAVESGMRIHISLGTSDLYGIKGMPAIVGTRLLQTLARETVRSDRPVLATCGDGMVGILSGDVQRAASERAATPEVYSSQLSQVNGLTPFSYVVGAQPVIEENQVAYSLCIGHFGGEVGLLIEACERGGTEIAGSSDDPVAQSILFAAATEEMVAEDLYVAGFSLNPDPFQWATVQTIDLMRWVVIGLIMVGVILQLFGIL